MQIDKEYIINLQLSKSSFNSMAFRKQKFEIKFYSKIQFEVICLQVHNLKITLKLGTVSDKTNVYESEKLQFKCNY